MSQIEEEIRKVCKMLKNGKAAGNDKIPYEMYKFGGPTICGKLKELYVEIWWNVEVYRYIGIGIGQYRPFFLVSVSAK